MNSLELAYSNTKIGSGAVAGKILLVTNAWWIRDCWDVPGSSNGVFEGNIARSGYKTANNKTAKLQNGEITKRRLLQNVEITKRRLLQNGDCYKTAKKNLPNILQKSFKD